MMSSPESHALAADKSTRVRHDALTHELASGAITRERTPELSLRTLPTVRAATRTAAQLVLALQATPLLGVAGAIALYWSNGGRGDALFGLGVLLLVSSVVAFQQLRARLVAHLEHAARLSGAAPRRAREEASSMVDKLVCASLRPERRSAGMPKRWPPIALD
jgi:hypothetical protein